jgi:hypothetical protein
MMEKIARHGFKISPLFTTIHGTGFNETQVRCISRLGTVLNFKSQQSGELAFGDTFYIINCTNEMGILG